MEIAGVRVFLEGDAQLPRENADVGVAADPVAADPALARERTVVSFGSRRLTSSLKLEQDQTAKKVDEAFQQIKRAVFQRLKDKGDLGGDIDFDRFRMSFNHNRQLAKWLVVGDQRRSGVYDHINDKELSEDARKSIVESHRAIVEETGQLVGASLQNFPKILAGSVGTLTFCSLGESLGPSDANLIGGGLHNKKGALNERREQIFQEYMQRDLAQILGNQKVRSESAIANDIGAILIYHRALVDQLEKEEKTLEELILQELQKPHQEESDLAKYLQTKLKKLNQFKTSIAMMHFGPLFMTKSYEVVDPAHEPNRSKVVQELKQLYMQQFALRNQGGNFVHRWINSKRAQNLERFEPLADKMASKEAFKGNRSAYYDYRLKNNERASLSIGPEEYVFDYLLDELSNEPGGEHALVKLPVLDEFSLDSASIQRIETALTEAKAQVKEYQRLVLEGQGVQGQEPLSMVAQNALKRYL